MFPLIGTEQLNLPFIINSLFFFPTKERNGIIFYGRDETRVNPNKEKLLALFECFKQFVELVVESEKA
jgi:hypothetical protein